MICERSGPILPSASSQFGRDDLCHYRAPGRAIVAAAVARRQIKTAITTRTECSEQRRSRIEDLDAARRHRLDQRTVCECGELSVRAKTAAARQNDHQRIFTACARFACKRFADRGSQWQPPAGGCRREWRPASLFRAAAGNNSSSSRKRTTSRPPCWRPRRARSFAADLSRVFFETGGAYFTTPLNAFARPRPSPTTSAWSLPTASCTALL
jgi:hypothetical protein